MFEQKKISKVLLMLSCVVIVLILLLCCNTFYWADDYANIVSLKNKGVLQNCIYGYYNWDGRFLSISGIVQGFGLFYLPVEILTLFWSLCFLISGVILYAIFRIESDIFKFPSINKNSIALILAIVFWLGAYSHFAETIYWGTGGVYSFDLLIGSFWVFQYLKLQQKKVNLLTAILFLLFSSIVGGMTQNLSTGLLTLVAITFLIDFLRHQKNKQIFNLWVLFFLLVGLIFIMIAPGNWLRFHQVNDSNEVKYSLLILVENFSKIFFMYLKKSVLNIFLAVILALCFGLIFFQRNINFKNLSGMNIRQIFILFLSNFKWFLVALATIIPFVFAPKLVSTRTVLFFNYFIFIFCFTITIRLFFSLKSKQLEKATQLVPISIFLITLLLTISILFSLYNLKKGRDLKQAILNREMHFKNRRNKSIKIKRIDEKYLKIPCYRFTDIPVIENVSNEWIRKSYEDYYHIKITVQD